MDKFTKTTEIDISTMHDVMEEETPKKNNFAKVIAIIISFIVFARAAIVFRIFITVFVLPLKISLRIITERPFWLPATQRPFD